MWPARRLRRMSASTDGTPVPPALKAGSLALSVLPVLRMAWIVFTVGENNLSNDYLFRVPLVAAMLDGRASIGAFLRHAWNGGGHSTLALTPVYWLSARFFAWDVRFELAVGLVAAAATLMFVAATLGPRVRWALLPLLSVLIFSTTKVSSFTFGESTLQMGFASLGVAIAAFAFARKKRPIAFAAWAAAGGLLASWSWGGGVVVWPVLFGALALRRERRIVAWMTLGAAAAAALAQYAWLFKPGESGAPPVPFSFAAKLRLFFEVLGRPLTGASARLAPEILGAAGLLLLVSTVFLLRGSLRANAAALVLAAWPAIAAAEIALVRTGAAPWYASPMALFWAALVLLLGAAPRLIRAAGTLGIAIATLGAQLTWESFYLPSRSPASAACLREYRTAPAACHARVFQWGDEGRLGELAALGAPLEERRLSVFGPSRTYFLQGDTAIGHVDLKTAGLAFLSRDGRTPRDATDFHRLDLVLEPGAAVTWRIDLPAETAKAFFETHVRTGTATAAATVTVIAEGAETGLAAVSGRAGSSLDLARFAGKGVVLRIEGGRTPTVLEAPRIELRIARRPKAP